MSAPLEFRGFGALSALDLHEILKLRLEVFVLEQRSFFPEIDGRDPFAEHCLARGEAGLAGTLRILGLDGREPLSVGRVAVRPEVRGAGLGRRMIEAALARLAARAPGREVRLGAQTHLLDYYAGFGFRPVSGEYDDGGIPHLDMALTLPAAA